MSSGDGRPHLNIVMTRSQDLRSRYRFSEESSQTFRDQTIWGLGTTEQRIDYLSLKTSISMSTQPRVNNERTVEPFTTGSVKSDRGRRSCDARGTLNGKMEGAYP